MYFSSFIFLFRHRYTNPKLLQNDWINECSSKTGSQSGSNIREVCVWIQAKTESYLNLSSFSPKLSRYPCKALIISSKGGVDSILIRLRFMPVPGCSFRDLFFFFSFFFFSRCGVRGLGQDRTSDCPVVLQSISDGEARRGRRASYGIRKYK